MTMRTRITIFTIFTLALLIACSSPNPQPPGLTPIPTLAPGATETLVPSIQSVATPAVPAATVPTSAALGAPIFFEHCTLCHGLLGQGGIGLPLRNSQYIQTGGDTAIFGTIANGRPGTEMPAWLQANGGPLTAAQITNVVAYLHTLQNVSPVPKPTAALPEPTETPQPANAPTPEPARPSNPGGPGQAATITGDATRGKAYFGQFCSVCHGPEGVQGLPNPDSDDGSVPALNPIDETIANTDPKIFAANVDLFIQHGSVPEGKNPMLMMPPFGDSNMLTQQQIADLIAYIISLNSTK